MMLTKRLKQVLAAAVLVAVAAAGPSINSAWGAERSLSDAHIGGHFDYARGQLPENIALAPRGRIDVTFAAAREVAQISPSGATRILATLPAPADGGVNTPVLKFALTTGIVRAPDGTLYVLYATGTAKLTGVWRIRPGKAPKRIAALPATGLPNGMALDPHMQTLYITDSVLGKIWRVPLAGGVATAWSSAPELASTGFLGANGMKIHHGAVWVTNLDKGTILRFPLSHRGGVQTRARGLAGIDDFTFIGSSDTILTALNGPGQVALVQPDGGHSIVLTAADGLQNPTSVALRGNTVYVLSAAYVTKKDPNLLLAHLNLHR